MRKKTIFQQFMYLVESAKYDWRQWCKLAFVAVSMVVAVVYAIISAMSLQVNLDSFFSHYSFFAIGVILSTMFHHAQVLDSDRIADEATRNEQATVAEATSRVESQKLKIQELDAQVVYLQNQLSEHQRALAKSRNCNRHYKARAEKAEEQLDNAYAFISYLRNSENVGTPVVTSEDADTAFGTVKNDTVPGIDDPDFTLSIFDDKV